MQLPLLFRFETMRPLEIRHERRRSGRNKGFFLPKFELNKND